MVDLGSTGWGQSLVCASLDSSMAHGIFLVSFFWCWQLNPGKSSTTELNLQHHTGSFEGGHAGLESSLFQRKPGGRNILKAMVKPCQGLLQASGRQATGGMCGGQARSVGLSSRPLPN